jgi:CrcB protein
MSARVLVAIGLLGGAGAVARFLVEGAVAARTAHAFPTGILVVNVSGALLLGILTGAGVHGDAYTLVATGLLGSYTTFSTWMVDTHRLAEDRRGRAAAANIAISLALGLAAAWLGRRVGASL